MSDRKKILAKHDQNLRKLSAIESCESQSSNAIRDMNPQNSETLKRGGSGLMCVVLLFARDYNL
ncbi:MAG: hypothetical protein DMG92_17540 [Acidobacteria bacterium]|nr:MAG: hypothetical protein DMG92_17540 [Acidobacteriota bacterium]